MGKASCPAQSDPLLSRPQPGPSHPKPKCKLTWKSFKTKLIPSCLKKLDFDKIEKSISEFVCQVDEELDVGFGMISLLRREMRGFPRTPCLTKQQLHSEALVSHARKKSVAALYAVSFIFAKSGAYLHRNWTRPQS